MPAFTFYASKDKLTNHGNKAGTTIGVEKINREAATLAREVPSSITIDFNLFPFFASTFSLLHQTVM
jgi:hypothetical protein